MYKRFQTFTVLIAKINRNIRRIKAEAMIQFNLKSPHVSCLYYLYENDSLTAKELCSICNEDKGAISRSIAHLEKNGYVVYEKSGDKKYNNKLILTEKGKNVGKFILDRVNFVLDKTNEGIGEEDRKILYRSLSIICDKLEQFEVESFTD